MVWKPRPAYIQTMMNLAMNEHLLTNTGPQNAALRDSDSVRRAIALCTAHWRPHPATPAAAHPPGGRCPEARPRAGPCSEGRRSSRRSRRARGDYDDAVSVAQDAHRRSVVSGQMLLGEHLIAGTNRHDSTG